MYIVFHLSEGMDLKKLAKLFASNKKWAKKIIAQDKFFFERLSTQQHPKYLWIGCSDSRVPANEICGLDPGEMFVHRNVANLVVHTDFNCLSVVQYAVDVLKVTDIIVCGHYGCGGIIAAMSNQSFGLIDNWLRYIKIVYAVNAHELDRLKESPEAQINRLIEMNIIKQLSNLSYTSIVQDAWTRGQVLNLHGWVYSLKDGLLRDLGVTVDSTDNLDEIFKIESAPTSTLPPG